MLPYKEKSSKERANQSCDQQCNAKSHRVSCQTPSLYSQLYPSPHCTSQMPAKSKPHILKCKSLLSKLYIITPETLQETIKLNKSIGNFANTAQSQGNVNTVTGDRIHFRTQEISCYQSQIPKADDTKIESNSIDHIRELSLKNPRHNQYHPYPKLKGSR